MPFSSAKKEEMAFIQPPFAFFLKKESQTKRRILKLSVEHFQETIFTAGTRKRESTGCRMNKVRNRLVKNTLKVELFSTFTTQRTYISSIKL